jgi:iron(II)-dependent oxidoreductase
MGADDSDLERWYSPTNQFLSPYREHLDEESPEHFATISKPYFIDKFEVTEVHYRDCVKAGRCPDRDIGSACFADGQVAIFFPELAGDHPATCLRYDAAETYCRWKGARLPTEAEWTLAGRGPAASTPGVCETAADLGADDGRCNERPYPWGDERDPLRANVVYHRGDGPEVPKFYNVHMTTPVGFYDGSDRGRYEVFDGSFRDSYQTHDGSSLYGVHDLVGNVFEWVGEWYDPAYYAAAPRMDPRGPASGAKRLLKSCSAAVNLGFRSLTARTSGAPEDLGPFGVRCVREVP